MAGLLHRGRGKSTASRGGLVSDYEFSWSFQSLCIPQEAGEGAFGEEGKSIKVTI